MFEILLEIIFLSLLSFGLIFGTKKATLTERGKVFFQKHSFVHPNTISIIRVPLALFGFYLYYKGYYQVSLLLYTIAVVSDAIDGIIARNCKLESPLGKSLDPLTDKLVYFIPIIFFAITAKISLIGAIVFIIIDTLGQFSRVLLDKLGMGTQANIWGKVKTTFIFLFIFYLLIVDRRFGELFVGAYDICIWILVLLAFLSVLFKFIKSPVIPK